MADSDEPTGRCVKPELPWCPWNLKEGNAGSGQILRISNLRAVCRRGLAHATLGDKTEHGVGKVS